MPQYKDSSKYQLPPRSTKGIPPKRYDPEFEAQILKYSNRSLTQSAIAFNTTLYSTDIPKTSEEALKSKEGKKAMEEEFSALIKNETWDRCLLPKDKKTIGCKWVFSIKYKADGTIKRYKTRIVAKGYTQTYGVMLTIRILFLQ